MNISLARALALILLLPFPLFAQKGEGENQAETPSGSVTLSDGALASGLPEGLNKSGELRWRVSKQLKPLAIPLTALVEMHLPGTPSKVKNATHLAHLQLTNGDTLHGQLQVLTPTHLTLNTSYAGALTVPRTMIQGVEIIAVEGAIYDGPDDLREWKITGGPDAWRLSSGVLNSSKAGSIARELDPPGKFRFGFDLAWRNSLRFRFMFLSDDGTSTQPDNCYDLVCQRRFVYLRKRWMTEKSGGSRIIGQSNLTALAEKEKVRFDFLIDREAGTIVLLVDGEEAERWTDNEPKVGSFGNWFHFVSEDFYPVQLSRIRLSEWDGKPPAEVVAKENLPEPEVKGQAVRLRDRTVLVGTPKSIENETLQIETDAGIVEVPLHQVDSIDLGVREYEEPIRKKGDIRAWTADGGRITFRLDEFGKDSVKGFSGIFGEAEYALKAFSRIEFNIYDESLEKLRGTVRW